MQLFTEEKIIVQIYCGRSQGPYFLGAQEHTKHQNFIGCC